MQAEGGWRQAEHALHRRSAVDAARILAPDLFSHRASLWHQRKCGLPQHQMVQKRLGQEQSFSVASPQGRCCKRAGLRHVLIDVTETPIERPPQSLTTIAPPKKTKALLFGQEEAAYIENSACRGKIAAPHPL